MEKQLFDYDETNIKSVVDYSQILLDKSLGQIIADYQETWFSTSWSIILPTESGSTTRGTITWQAL